VSNEYNSSIDNSPIAGFNSTSPQNNTSRDDVEDSCDGVATTTDRVDFSQTHLNESWFTQYICEKYLNATQIDLSHNKISYLENFIFAKFESIRHVNISFNQIEKIDEYAFCIIHVGNDIQFLPGEIEEIDLSNNKLNYFPTNHFARKWERMEELGWSSCGVGKELAQDLKRLLLIRFLLTPMN
jgi:Leucine-rich repeat (LRR) protein